MPPPTGPGPDPSGEPDQADEAVRAAKSVLRSAVLLRRDLRSPATRAAEDAARAAVLRDRLGDVRTTVAAYLSADVEPGTLELIAWLAATERRVLLPVLTDGAGSRLAEPAWAPYQGPDRLRAGRRGILEPTGATLSPEALGDAAVVICPGLAADGRGHRLGRGGGWYDHALAYAADGAVVAVLLNDDEVFEVVPTQPWDRPVAAVVTPTGWTDVRPGAEPA